MDKREQILNRLHEVLQGMTEFETVERNRGELPSIKRPALVMLDADEAASEGAYGRNRPGYSPNIVIMSPEIYLLLGGRPDRQQIGSVLNNYRRIVLNAVLTDQVLAELVGSNGEIRYAGCVTDLASGRPMEGEMMLQISFVYVLNPLDLQQE